MSRRLLLADDSVTIQKVMEITLSDKDYILQIASNGDEALLMAGNEKPDLILADVFMPGKDGYEVCAAVRSNPELQTVPVLLLAGTFEPFDQNKAQQVGANGWIVKPFSSQALIDKVEEMLALAPAKEQWQASPSTAPGDQDILQALEEVTSRGVAQETAQPDVAPAAIESDSFEIPSFETNAASAALEPDSFDVPSSEPASAAQPVASEVTSEPFSFSATEESAPAVDPFAASAEAQESATEPEQELEPFVAFDVAEQSETQAEPTSAPAEPEPFAGQPESFEFPEPVAEATSEVAVDPFAATGREEFSFDTQPETITESKPEPEPALEAEPEPEPASEPEPVAQFDTAALQPEPEPQPEVDLPPLEEFQVAAPETTPEPETPAVAVSDDGVLDLREEDIIEEGVYASEPSRVEKRVAFLSDEQLTEIVERVAGAVIERLATPLLEQVVWEVVPDLAESMVREEMAKIKPDA